MKTRVLNWKAWVAVALTLVGTTSLAGKGGKGKPGGGDPPADPAIVFLLNGDVRVIDEDGSNDVRVFDGDTISTDDPAWSPDGSQIVFATDVQGDGIYVMNADGTGLTRILALDNSSYVWGIAWSPVATADGEAKIAFSARDTAGVYDLYVVNTDGSGLQNLTSNSVKVMTPTWSPAADRIAVKAGFPQRVLVYELGLADGALSITSTTDITSSGPLPTGDINNPKWAKTKDLIAVYTAGDSLKDLWVIPVDDPGNAYRVVVGDGAWASSSPSWSSDDTQILYGSFDASAKKQGENLRVLTLATGSVAEIYRPRNGNLGGSDWRR